MKNTLGLCALLILAAMTASCSKIFEPVGSDPHPPTVEVTELVYWVATPTPTPVPARAGAGSAPRARSIVWNSGGFTVSVGQKFQVGRAYTDAGGDILKFSIRDRDGALKTDMTPPEGQTYYSGTSGTILGPEAGLELVGVLGLHRLELWAEDSHGSRSEKVEFTITLAP